MNFWRPHFWRPWTLRQLVVSRNTSSICNMFASICTIFVFIERPSAFKVAFTSLNMSVTKYGPFYLGLNLGLVPALLPWSRTHTLSPTLKLAPLTVRSYRVLALNAAASRFTAAKSNIVFISFFWWSMKSETIHSTSIFALSFVWSYSLSIGYLGIRPNISSKGENFVTTWTAVLSDIESLSYLVSQSSWVFNLLAVWVFIGKTFICLVK